MAIDAIYDSVAMTTAVRERRAKSRFFTGLFPDATPVGSEYMAFDQVENGGNGVATYVSPLHKSQLVGNRGFDTKIISWPLTKEHKVTEAHKLLQRTAGEAFSGDMSPQQRAAAKLVEDLAELADRIDVAKEVQCAGAQLDGSYEIDGLGVKKTIDFGRASALKPSALSGTARWGQSADDKLADIRNLVDLIEDNGYLMADNVLLGKSAYASFLADDDMQKLLDNRRVEIGEVRPGAVVDGLRYIGFLADPGVKLWTYAGSYLDPAGSIVRLMPANKIHAWASAARRAMHYGPIPVPGGAFIGKVYSYPKEIDDPPCTQAHVQSSFLAVPFQPNGAATLQVMDS